MIVLTPRGAPQAWIAGLGAYTAAPLLKTATVGPSLQPAPGGCTAPTVPCGCADGSSGTAPCFMGVVGACTCTPAATTNWLLYGGIGAAALLALLLLRK